MGQGSGVKGQGVAGLGGYSKLKAWQVADDLAFVVVNLSRSIGSEDRWLAAQLKRAATSVPANIVEGYSRLSLREYLHHLSIARASLAETEYWLHFTRRLGFITDEQHAQASPLLHEAGNLLYGLIRALAKRLQSGDARTNQSYLIRDGDDSRHGRDDLDDPDLSNLDP